MKRAFLLLALVACQRDEPPTDIYTDGGFTAERDIEAPVAEVWAKVIDTRKWSFWSPWIRDIEPIGRFTTPELGMRYRAVLALDDRQVPAEIEIVGFDDEARLAWRITPMGESGRPIVETIALSSAAERVTRARYEVRYEARSGAVRMTERIRVRETAELVQRAVEQLRRHILSK